MSQITEEETTDEVIREIRNIKESLAQAMEFDVDRILADARAKQTGSDRKVVSPPSKDQV